MSSLYEKYGDQLAEGTESIPYFSWLIDQKTHSYTPNLSNTYFKMPAVQLEEWEQCETILREGGGITHLLSSHLSCTRIA